ncbi:hypothetical protein [Streptomyces niveus]|uniref:hypothetical protein n=1 Tax=Streptomyces niveus TaxID=193462 RepID=UPI003689D004
MSSFLSRGSLTGLPALLAVGIAVTGVVALAAAGWTSRRRAARSERRPGSPAVKVAAVAAVGCTAYSADTSWRFAADYLDMAGTVERAMMFGAAELALFATALMARQNLNSQGAPGLPGSLIWVITGVQIIPAYAESGPVGGTVRAFVGPVMAAMLWHLAMGIELRLHKPDAASKSLLARLGREVRERLLSRLGIAARDRDAVQITRDRATTRAVTLATRLAERTPAQRQGWRGRRLTRRLSKAVGRAAVGTDPAQRAQLLDQLAARRHALALATVALPSPWTVVHNKRADAVSDTAPSPGDRNTSVPGDGPRAETESFGTGHRGPVPESEKHDAGTDVGTERSELGTDEKAEDSAGTDAVVSDGDRVQPAGQATPEPPAAVHRRDRHRQSTGAGTVRRGDRGQLLAVTGTARHGDRDRRTTPVGTETGTEKHGDRERVRTVPVRRNQRAKGKRNRSQTRQAKVATKRSTLSMDQLVARVRPHVPAVLEWDGNEAVTRVQLREILRREGLRGGRNDRLGPVLQELRTETTT